LRCVEQDEDGRNVPGRLVRNRALPLTSSIHCLRSFDGFRAHDDFFGEDPFANDPFFSSAFNNRPAIRNSSEHAQPRVTHVREIPILHESPPTNSNRAIVEEVSDFEDEYDVRPRSHGQGRVEEPDEGEPERAPECFWPGDT
jgi:hypothetical protein